ncbi:MAG TPA: ATP-binding cassette domain-containing protein, partial [Chryseolinea sp.]|nr:ATP-binding cassette domain-containing protein [Chryseolinea sp.]
LSENIAFGISPNEINRNKVLQIIDDLDLNDVVRQLPGGIDSRIGERGSKLSGGQRQRIAIARALYADVEILLFDEATNQVHSSLESDILDLLNYISRKNKTIIMVTHKIQANFFDSIFHLEKSAMKEVEVTHD